MYPRVVINITKLEKNAKIIHQMCIDNEISSCFLVVKVLAGFAPVVRRLAKIGFTHLADSRIENLIKYKSIPLPKVLIRLPMGSDAKRIVKYADISLNSELSTIIALNEAAKTQNKVHGIILMFDLGDLREGIFYQDDFLPIVGEILQLSNIKLLGIGTNLTCYGGVIPDEQNLNLLGEIKKRIENKYQIKLDIISGGNSSTLYLFNQNRIPKVINNLRIGEAVFLGRETAYGKPIIGMHGDVFSLRATIIEIQKKPSYPIGNIGFDAFGRAPDITDVGMMRRAILAIGRQDVEIADLIPFDSRIKIIGGSSDHLIVDLGSTKHKTGDILKFNVNYPGLLRLMTSPYVRKILRWK
ncbi:MAG: ornithine racemase Orr [Candidatus Izemoplasmatales bacterium]|nr:ornithine racemase Orr [Candidatus Izemoplasmatales bacterium]MDD3865059.1 ornithine racemase Orr [Candidatus Izemoplasmatales bacterium]